MFYKSLGQGAQACESLHVVDEPRRPLLIDKVYLPYYNTPTTTFWSHNVEISALFYVQKSSIGVLFRRESLLNM